MSQPQLTGGESYLPETHRMQPRNEDAEQGLIGSILLSPKRVFEMCDDACVTPDHFHIPAHSTIYKELLGMRGKSTEIDFITLTAVLRNHKTLDTLGGAAFITNLFTCVPTAANASRYIDIIQEKYTLRRIINGCTECVALAFDDTGDVTEVSSRVQATLLDLTSNPQSEERSKSMKENLFSVMDRITNISSGQEQSGLLTGLKDFDHKLGGLHKGEVIVVSGVTGGGKTSLAHNIIDHVSVILGQPSMLFSYEMRSLWVTSRMICARGHINTESMRRGNLDAIESMDFSKAFQEMSEAPIFIEDNADLSVQQMRARARRRKASTGLSLIVVDYIQKVRNEHAKKGNSRQRDVAEVSDEVQKMAMELNVPVIVLSQLNNNGEVREASDIAFDAKTVLKIKREDESLPIEDEPDFVKRNIVICKNNNGAVGKVPVTFLKPFVKFANYHKEK